MHFAPPCSSFKSTARPLSVVLYVWKRNRELERTGDEKLCEGIVKLGKDVKGRTLLDVRPRHGTPLRLPLRVDKISHLRIHTVDIHSPSHEGTLIALNGKGAESRFWMEVWLIRKEGALSPEIVGKAGWEHCLSSTSTSTSTTIIMMPSRPSLAFNTATRRA